MNIRQELIKVAQDLDKSSIKECIQKTLNNHDYFQVDNLKVEFEFFDEGEINICKIDDLILKIKVNELKIKSNDDLIDAQKSLKGEKFKLNEITIAVSGEKYDVDEYVYDFTGKLKEIKLSGNNYLITFEDVELSSKDEDKLTDEIYKDVKKLVESDKGAELFDNLRDASIITAGTNKRQLSKDIKTKSGVEFKKGEEVTLTWEVNKWNIAYINASGDRKCAIKTESLPKYISTIKEPSMNALEKMTMDGIAKSILGNKVEPDGWDQYDSPSWLLAMGLI